MSRRVGGSPQGYPSPTLEDDYGSNVSGGKWTRNRRHVVSGFSVAGHRSGSSRMVACWQAARSWSSVHRRLQIPIRMTSPGAPVGRSGTVRRRLLPPDLSYKQRTSRVAFRAKQPPPSPACRVFAESIPARSRSAGKQVDDDHFQLPSRLHTDTLTNTHTQRTQTNQTLTGATIKLTENSTLLLLAGDDT